MMRKTAVRVGMVVAALAAFAFLDAALVGCVGLAPVSKSVVDRVLPTRQMTVYAHCPDPASYDDSYADAAGTGANYVYDVDAVSESGEHVTVTLILFDHQASGEGWLEIEARGTSGVHYQSVDETEVPQAALDALGAQ